MIFLNIFLTKERTNMSRSLFHSSLIRKKQIIDMDKEIYLSMIKQISSNIKNLESRRKKIKCECNDSCSFESQKQSFETSNKKIKELLCDDLLEYISIFYKTDIPTCLNYHTKQVEFFERQIYIENENIRRIHEKYEETVVSFLKNVEDYKERYCDDLVFKQCSNISRKL